jgi:hypothetical protein
MNRRQIGCGLVLLLVSGAGCRQQPAEQADDEEIRLAVTERPLCGASHADGRLYAVHRWSSVDRLHTRERRGGDDAVRRRPVAAWRISHRRGSARSRAVPMGAAHRGC